LIIAVVIDHGIWPLDFNNKHIFMLNLSAQFQPSSFYFSNAIAIAKATMAIVGQFQTNPKKEIQGSNLQCNETRYTTNYGLTHSIYIVISFVVYFSVWPEGPSSWSA
jgi:hypothetical protein